WMIVLDVLQSAVDAQLAGEHRNVVGRAREDPGVGHELDHGHRPEPEAVPRAQRVVLWVHARGRGGGVAGDRRADLYRAPGIIRPIAARRAGRVVAGATRITPTAEDVGAVLLPRS